MDISTTGEHTGSTRVVLDSAGNATAVWHRWDGSNMVVEAAYRPAGEGWEVPVPISEVKPEGEPLAGATNATNPRLVVDRNNNVTVVWERYAGTKIVLQSIDRPAGGDWGEPEDFGEASLGPAPEPWIAVDWEGNATAVWKKGEVIQAAFRPFAGEWQSPLPLSGEESFVP